jgi:hypothetical protein
VPRDDIAIRRAYFVAMQAIQPSPAEVAVLVGNPARANVLIALLDGRALTATGLAAALAARCFELDWISRGRDTRAVPVTFSGKRVLRDSCFAASSGWGIYPHAESL